MFFGVGVFVQTTIGGWLHNKFENRFKKIIPIYKMVKDVVNQLLGDGINFEKAVLAQPFGPYGAYVVGFQTGTCNGLCSVYVPTSPNPSNGSNFVLPSNLVTELDIDVSEASKIIMSLGQGSAKLIEQLYKDKP
jgi:uncharacterized membrane protein